VDLHYRSGGFQGERFAAILAGNAMVFTYDLTTETLRLKAKVTLVSQAQATGGM
jgi:hypothetical protein